MGVITIGLGVIDVVRGFANDDEDLAIKGAKKMFIGGVTTLAGDVIGVSDPVISAVGSATESA